MNRKQRRLNKSGGENQEMEPQADWAQRKSTQGQKTGPHRGQTPPTRGSVREPWPKRPAGDRKRQREKLPGTELTTRRKRYSAGTTGRAPSGKISQLLGSRVGSRAAETRLINSAHFIEIHQNLMDSMQSEFKNHQNTAHKFKK
jgi:hypothetical protein